MSREISDFFKECEEVLDAETKTEERKKDPQIEDEEEGEDVADVSQVRMVITLVGGKLDVQLEGFWRAKYIRAIPVAAIKAYRRWKQEQAN